MSTLQTFWDNLIPYRIESVRFFVLMNSASKLANHNKDKEGSLGSR